MLFKKLAERRRQPRRFILSYRGRVLVIALGFLIGGASIMLSNNFINHLRVKERMMVQLWGYAMSVLLDSEASSARYNSEPDIVHMVDEIVRGNTIPFIITDEYLDVLLVNNFNPARIDDPRNRQYLIRKMADAGNVKEVPLQDGRLFYIFYDNSPVLKSLIYFPYVQIGVIFIFIVFTLIAFGSSKQNEQNRVWIGLAKETAHQLGTPISSLMGWIGFLETQGADRAVTDEMAKDVTRLKMVAERFSKIGSETTLSPTDIYAVMDRIVDYFRSRIPNNVYIWYNEAHPAPLPADLNEQLFEWVIENIIKNALDALQGKGTISVNIKYDARWIYIDISDSGKGIAAANFKKVFSPGYTTKTRGWGLGLSLSKRIVEEYHRGRIFIHSSEPGVGTTVRIILRRATV